MKGFFLTRIQLRKSCLPKRFHDILWNPKCTVAFKKKSLVAGPYLEPDGSCPYIKAEFI